MHVVSVQHNHVHVPIFHERRANAALDVVLHLLCGIPTLLWRVHHLSRHHGRTWGPDDWSSPFLFRGARAPDHPVGYRYYELSYLPLFLFESGAHVLRRRRPRELRALLVTSTCFVAATMVSMDAFGVVRHLVVVWTGYTLGGILLGAANYVEHWNVQDGSARYRAWTFTCPIHNFLAYNVGYHQLHHDHPRLHWSLLHRLHRETNGAYARADLVETGLYPSYRRASALRRWLAEAKNRGTPSESAARSAT
jgi:fatty acid desaturase